ncbi:MAG TPA: 50S ribosomal protein L37e [Candidatus Nanoarchaeia archaeon]|nr:50S ribosomal protein L37e [Candidatus Nanoarchaeia archaeon]
MTKGTASMGKRSRFRLHIRCRRCGESSYHKQKGRCSHCGFGATTKLRQFNWQKKSVI